MIGGGTVLDTGKMINILFSYTCKASDLVGFKSTGRTFIPMVALPTTAGTGSECTHFAVLYRDMVKYSVADPGLVPDYVILAPELTLSMPKMLAVHTGFDALAQAIESYWSINATDESKGYAREALSLIRQRFTVSVQQADFQSRSAMQKAAFLSGKAINIAQTTAAHAVSYPMSSFFGIPHGLAVFLTLPSIYAFNGGVSDADCTDPRGVAYVQQVMAELGEMIGGNDTTGAAEILRSYLNAFSIDSRLSAYGIADEQAINRILDHGFNPQRMKNNPRRITRQDLSALLREIL
jgi:alcohol dehydrogenase class IV